MTKDEPIPKTSKTNHVKFESMTFNGIQIPIGTTSFKSESEYPPTVSLMTCSHKHGYFAIGTTDGFLLGEMARLRQHLRASKVEPTLRQLDSVVNVHVPLPVRQLHLSADELRIIVCMGQTKVVVYDVKDIVEKKNNAQPKWSFTMNNEIMDFKPCPTTTVPPASTAGVTTIAPTALADITNKNGNMINIHNHSMGYSRLALVLVKNINEKMGHACFMIDWLTGFIRFDISYNYVSSVCWSSKGDEFICGYTDGSIRGYSIFGLKKFEISPPPPRHQQEGDKKEEGSTLSSRHVKEVLWLDQNTLFAIYTNEQDNDARIVKRPTKPECTIKYISLDDVAPIANDHRSLGCIEKSKLLHHGQKFYTHVIHNFGPDIKYAIIIANTISHNLMVVGCYQCQTIEEEDKENNENSGEAKGYWATWSCPSYVNHFYQNNKNSGDDQVIATSTAKTTTTTTTTAASSITCQRRAKSQLATFKCGNNSTESIHPVGMTVDYSTTPSGFAKTYDSATPMLYYITNAGMIKGYTVNRSDKPFFSMYDGMVPVVSPLNKIPSPTTTGQKQEGNREENEASSSLLTATYIPTREAYAEILKSHSPFADAVKRYEQNEQSLWKEHRNVPSFRTLGTKPNARSPTTYWYSSAKPKFGETSMPGFRFGTTPRFGDSGPTRFGVPFNEEKSSLTLATGQYSLYGPKKETVEQRASSTERVVLNLNVAAPKLIDNNKITRREYSFGRPFIQQNSFSSTSTTHSSDFGFTSMNNNNNTPVKTQHNHLTTVPSPVNSKATNTTNNQKSTLFHYNPKAEMKYKENVSNNTRIIGGFAALNEGFTTMTTASHLKESQAAVVLNDSGENSSTSGPSLPQLCFCGKSGTHNHTSNNYNNIKSTKLEVTMDEKKTTSSSTRKNDNISIVPTSSTKPKDSNNTVQSNEIAHSSNPSQSTPSKVVGNVFGSGQTQVNEITRTESCDSDITTTMAAPLSTTGSIHVDVDKEKVSQAGNNKNNNNNNSTSECTFSTDEGGCIDEATVTGLSVPSENDQSINGNKLNVKGLSIIDDEHDDEHDDFRQRTLGLLKAAGETYASLLQELQKRLPLEKEEGSASASTTKGKGSSKIKHVPEPPSQPEQYIQIKDVSSWLFSLRDSIDSLECDIVEKEEELRQMKQNLNQMQDIYTNAMNESRIRTVMIHEEENLEGKDEKLYEQTAQHLRREVFMDHVVSGVVELQQQQPDKGKIKAK